MASRIVLPFADVGDGVSPADGAKLTFAVSGTSTPKDTYSDEALTTANANPVVADADGVFGDIWATDGARYKVTLTDKNDVQIWEADPVIAGLLNGAVGLVYDTVADMKLANPSAGTRLITLGYYAVGDGGGAAYLTEASASVDGYGDHTLAGGTIATLQSEGAANAKQYGAKGDGATDDSTAIQAAVDAGIGVFFPPGTYEMRGINIDGSDQYINAPTGAVLSDVVSQDGTAMFVFGATTAVDRLRFYAHKINVDAGGGHVFDMQGTFNHSRLEVGHIDQNETGKSIINHSDTSFFFNKIFGINWAITTSHTVPAINLNSVGSKISANVIDILRPDRSGTVPYMHLLNSTASSYNYNNILSLRNPEVCNGGLLKTSRSFGTVLRDTTCFDTGTTTNHMIEVGQSSLVCQNFKIENYQRNGGTLGSGKVDIMATDAISLRIDNPHGASSGVVVEIDLNSQPSCMIVGGEYYTVVNGASTNSLFNDANGGVSTPSLKLPEQSGSLTIASGVITVTDSVHRVDTEASASTDDLDTINGGISGQLLIIKSSVDSRDVTAKDSTGNLFLAGDFTLSNRQDTLLLMYDSTLSGWLEISRSDNLT